MKKILITGGQGFIGFNLCKVLIQKGCQVFSLDCNLSERCDRKVLGVKYFKGNTVDIFNILKSFEFDVIFHLGEYSRVSNSFDNMAQVSNSNIMGTAQILEFWRERKCKLIYAGSSTKFSEIKAETPYSFTKSNNTELVKKYGEWFDLEYSITYFYNVFGEGENEISEFATLIGIFKNRKKKSIPLEIVLPGSQKRNFTHIKDTVNALILILEEGKDKEYHIGSDKKYSVLEVAKMFNSDIKFINSKKGDRKDSFCDNSKIKKLGWKEQYYLKDYINMILK